MTITPHTPLSTRTPTASLTQLCLPLPSFLIPPNKTLSKSQIPMTSTPRSTSTSCGLWRCSPTMLETLRQLDLPKPWIRYPPDSRIPRHLAFRSTPPVDSTFCQSWPGWRLGQTPPSGSVRSTSLAHSSSSTFGGTIPPSFTLPRVSSP